MANTISLQFSNGQIIKTRCTKPAAAISKAVNVSPVKGSIIGTKLLKNGQVFGEITEGFGWVAV